MTWTLAWSWVAQHRDLFTIGYPQSERVAMALVRLAATNRGQIEQIHPDDPNRFRLRVKGAEARLFIDRRAGTIFVTRIYRSRR